jgi:hypothetical protein
VFSSRSTVYGPDWRLGVAWEGVLYTLKALPNRGQASPDVVHMWRGSIPSGAHAVVGESYALNPVWASRSPALCDGVVRGLLKAGEGTEVLGNPVAIYGGAYWASRSWAAKPSSLKAIGGGIYRQEIRVCLFRKSFPEPSLVFSI